MRSPHDTQSLDPVTQDIYRPLYRPSPPPRRRVFPRGWRDAMCAAWAAAGFAALFMFGAAGAVLLEMAARK